MRLILIYLDTHVVVWLYAGSQHKLSIESLNLINQDDIVISSIVKLELQYLFEIKRINFKAEGILNDLLQRIGLKECNKPFIEIINKAINITWTRDPFDRIIVANASIENNILLTKDNIILDNYKYAKG